ncbi:MAG: sugar transferase [Isosphaeraceae bacterium]
MLRSMVEARGEGGRARPVLVHITTVPETLDFVAGQVAAMRSRGYEVHAIAAPGARLDAFGDRMGIPCHGVPMTRRIDPAGDLMALLRLWWLLRRLRPAIVHAHSPKGGLLGMVAAWAAGVPGRVYSLLGLPLDTATGWRRRALFWSDRIACALANRRLSVSPSLREAIDRARVCRADRVDVLANGSPGGVEARGRFNPAVVGQAVRLAARRRLGIPASARVIGFVGRIARDKGIVELLDAWRRLRREDPGLHLLLVGPMEPHDPIPQDTAEKIVTDDRVHLAGPVDDPAPYYAAMDLLALPTYREGFGQVLIEAAAMRLPVVASRVVGCVDSVVDGVTGTLVPAGDSAALAAALRAYLIAPALRQKHGEAARSRALRDFEPESVFEATAALYAGLLRPARAGAAGSRAIKRLMDVVLSAAGLIGLAPIMAVVAIAVGLKMGRPVLFRQVRPGQGGRPFVLYKFRTMRQANAPDGGPLPDADRLTALGAFLRRTSLDELPQLWNVLKGDMSLVGPRPLLVEYLPHYDDRQRTRHDVQPGITGLAQVHGRNELPWDLRLELDARYVEQLSIRLDVAILVRTVMNVVRGSGVALDTIRFDDFARRGARTGGRA